MKQTKQHENQSLPLALLCIFLGMLLNEFVVEEFLAPDGDISSSTFRFTLIAQQLILIAAGLYLAAKRPFISGTFVRFWAARISLGAASLALSLTVAELVLRSMIPAYANEGIQHHIAHPVVGWKLRPGARDPLVEKKFTN